MSRFPALANQHVAYFDACPQYVFRSTSLDGKLGNATSDLHLEAFRNISFAQEIFVSEAQHMGLAHRSVEIGDEVSLCPGSGTFTAEGSSPRSRFCGWAVLSRWSNRWRDCADHIRRMEDDEVHLALLIYF
jgi:hypothetical protein